MTVIFEIDGPVQLRPFWFRSRVMVRVGWLFFAVAISKLGLHEFGSGNYGWNRKSGYQPFAEAETQQPTNQGFKASPKNHW